MGEVMSCCAANREEASHNTKTRSGRKSKHSKHNDEVSDRKLEEATKESGDLTREDRELLKSLLKDLAAPNDINVKVEMDGRDVNLTLDMKNRLLVEGAGAKTRRFPFNSMRNVQFGEKGGRECFQVDFEVPLPGDSGTVTYFPVDGSSMSAKELAHEIRDIIDSVSQDDYPLANFGVLKINPQGKHQARLLQLDIPNRLLSNVHKGDIKSQFHFSEISEVQDSPDTCNFTLFFRDYRPYEFICQTIEDKNILLKIFRSISIGSYTVANLTHDDLEVMPFWPAKTINTGMMDKKGDMGWDKRYVVLTKSRLFVFRQKGSRNPLNVITLLGTSVEKQGEDEIKITMRDRDFRFKAPARTARDSWFTFLQNTMEKSMGSYNKYLSSTLKRVIHDESHVSRRQSTHSNLGHSGSGGHAEGRHSHGSDRRPHRTDDEEEGGGGGGGKSNPFGRLSQGSHSSRRHRDADD